VFFLLFFTRILLVSIILANVCAYAATGDYYCCWDNNQLPFRSGVCSGFREKPSRHTNLNFLNTGWFDFWDLRLSSGCLQYRAGCLWNPFPGYQDSSESSFGDRSCSLIYRAQGPTAYLCRRDSKSVGKKKRRKQYGLIPRIGYDRLVYTRPVGEGRD